MRGPLLFAQLKVCSTEKKSKEEGEEKKRRLEFITHSLSHSFLLWLLRKPSNLLILPFKHQNIYVLIVFKS